MMRQRLWIHNKDFSSNVLMKLLKPVSLSEDYYLDNSGQKLRSPASIPLHKLKGSKTGVYTATFSHDYEIVQFRDPDNMSYYHANGVQITAASRLSYFFDLRGPSISIDSACSGTGNAIHLACQSIRCGEADQAVVSGGTLFLDPDPVMGMNKLQYAFAILIRFSKSP
jgi:acyl transferase domain-containing protein